MGINTSALVAILLDEPEPHRFNQQIAADAVRLLSAATLVETAIVFTSRTGPRAQLAISLSMPWPKPPGSPFYSRARTFPRRISLRCPCPMSPRRHRSVRNLRCCFPKWTSGTLRSVRYHLGAFKQMYRDHNRPG